MTQENKPLELAKLADRIAYLEIIIEAEREKVRKLVEALKFECGNRCSDINPCNAKEVLKEIEET